ncbi:DUF2185 domain-containing protein [Listeria sp. FSL L7-1517]|uniref:immunity protein Imm33 domain-containing protein n=1 Tax=Listeria immobilis TaxID=2713502 RepID=UPI00164D24DD|nr:DUF2185 domain-containing protein [Listeria immobilis]MBC6295598.1 DUF2185 domain-containing protein [Listeria immobilis]
MKINNSEYGGFVVSNNIISGQPVHFSYREKSAIPQLNGWTLYSIIDNQEYVSEASNFKILNAESLFRIVPVMAEIFSAPYGTDIEWLYEENVHIGFYDLVTEKTTTIETILNQ